MKLIICGFGRMGKSHAMYYRGRDDIEVEGVVDPCAARLALAREIFPRAETAVSVDQLATSADVADICSPPVFHEDQSLSFLSRRIGVICEKPAVLDGAAGGELSALADRVGRILHPVHNYLFSPTYKMLSMAVGTGRVGDVRRLEVNIQRPCPAQGIPEWSPTWRVNRDIGGGGILIDHGIHWIYVLLHLLGRPQSVCCTMRMSSEVEYAARLKLLFPELSATIRLSWDAHERSTAVTVEGSEGIFCIRDGRASFGTAGGRRQLAVVDFDDSQTHSSWFPEMFGEFEILFLTIHGSTPEWGYAVSASQIVQLAHYSHLGDGLPVAYDGLMP